MKAAIAFACGLLFALGLGLSGMLQPVRVIGFLDFFGDWVSQLGVSGPPVVRPSWSTQA